MKLRYIFIPVLCVLLMSHNSFAIDLTQDVDYKEVTNGALYYRVFDNNSWGSFYNGGTYSMGNTERITALQFRNTGNSLPADTKIGDFFTLGMWVQFDGTGNHWNTSGYYYITDVTNGVSCPILDIDSNTIQNFNDSNGNTSQRHMLFITCKVTSASPSAIGINLGLRSVASGMRFNPVTYSHWRRSSNSISDDLTAIKNAVNNMSSAIQKKLDKTNDKLDELNISIKDLNDAQQEASDNISNQTPSDMGSSVENQQTTSIINLFGSFLSALTSVNAGSCVIQLPFPSYAGGNWTMNICQYKDKAGNIISLFGSATLILFYLPVAWRLLGMIYNEIRSFTNG